MPYTFEQFLNVRNALRPSFSPDGQRVAFLTDVSGVPQLWSVPAAGGSPQQLTDYAERIIDARYAPAGQQILFSMDQGVTSVGSSTSSPTPARRSVPDRRTRGHPHLWRVVARRSGRGLRLQPTPPRLLRRICPRPRRRGGAASCGSRTAATASSPGRPMAATFS